jgi:replicative DNA helicase
MTKDLFDSNAAMYVLAYMMHNPQSIYNNKKYLLSVSDFPNPVYQILFGVIFNLSAQGVKKINPQDVEFNVTQWPEQSKIFHDSKGYELTQSLNQLPAGDDEAQFDIHYDRLKKFTTLRDLEKCGIDTTKFYNPNAEFFNLDAENQKLDKESVQDIIDAVRLELVKIEKGNAAKEEVYLRDAAEGLKELKEEFKETPDVGPEIDGSMLNFITRGARPGKMYLYSAPQAHGKTRFMVGVACKMALPYIENGKVVVGNLRKVYYCATEQEPDEIQTMILAYVSGVNEAHILSGHYNEGEEQLVDQAIQIIEKYKDNLLIDRIADPSVAIVRQQILEMILEKNVDMVIYDYIFIPTDDDQSAQRHQYRTDQVLMMFANTIKEIAVAYNVFILTGTQVNGTWEGKFVRNQNMIRDAKSIADKVDVGMIGTRLEEDEYKCIETYVTSMSLEMPNYVVDVYKNRRGEITNCKIFRYFDFGTLRCRDILVTTQSFKLITNVGKIDYGTSKVVDLLDFITGGEHHE